MNSKRWLIQVAPALALACAVSAVLAAPVDAEMNRLAADSGCALCHSARPTKSVGDAVPPPAPAWSDIARRYRGRPGAEDALVATVMRGAGTGARHWAGKTSAVEMPANRVEIREEDARTLIRWILR